MNVSRSVVTLLVAAFVGGTALVAQEPAPPPVQDPTAPATVPAPPQGLPPMLPLPPDVDEVQYYRPVVRVGTPFSLTAGNVVREVVVIMSDATINGRVSGDVVVVLGELRLGPNALVSGSAVVVGGGVTVEPGAAIQREFVVVGGVVNAPPEFVPGREHVVIGPPIVGEWMRSVAPWFTRGLLWGRMIVPGLPWIWGIVGIVLLVNVAMAVAFPGAVRASAETLSARPLAAFFVGLLTLLLFAPVVTILAISVVGIIVIPFLCCAVVVGWMLGKVAVSRWIGAGVVREEDPDDRVQAVRSVLIGFAIVCLTYMVPLLGVMAWTIVGVLGLGTATLTLAAGMKRERPLPPARPPADATPPVPPPGPPFMPEASAPSSAAFAAEADAFAAAAVPSSPSFAAAGAPGVPLPDAPSGPPPGIGGPPRVGDLTAFPRASFLDRVAAAVLDLLLVAIAYNLFNWWHDGGVFFILLMGYHIGFWTWKGTTVGGIICNLRLVRVDGSPLRPADALVRGLASLFSFAALGLGFLWILRDPDRQAWHDKIAGTYVVTVPRNWEI
jgi:hypothetical protein